ncbi:MAG: mannitol dehydrogenase family protein, partial [Litoreibacter sp.]|nr:mannitol dehydrogenase family protein [Litoreibacter sp.]
MDELMDTLKTKPARLSDHTLGTLPEAILRPTYDRQALTPGIVHIGLGNFHRAHQAWYLHRLMQQGLAKDWGIIGASVRHHDAAQRQALIEQDYLTTLVELDPSGTSAEVVGSMIGYLPIEDGNAALISQLADPAIRIASLTVTEGGYFLDPATKRFDASHPDILHDAQNLDAPRTAFGAIVAALRSRKNSGLGPFTCQSCDNLPGNGVILKEVVTGLATLADKALSEWIEGKVSFPNSMVDCIVPATGPSELALAQKVGISDQVPVTHENFRQWVLEDDFCAGRPPWEKVGATFTDRVHDFEAMKLRLLNGTHQIIAAPAELLGLHTIAQTMESGAIKAFFRKVALSEIAPHVPTLPGMTPQQYVDLVDSRFSNPAIHDTVRRVAFDGASRHTGAVLPVIRDAIAGNTALDGLALSQALWAHMCAGLRQDGSEIEPNDPIWDQLTRAAQGGSTTWLGQGDLYGDIVEDDRYVSSFKTWFARINEDGV